MRGFPLPDSNWFFTRGFEDGKWRIQIHHGTHCVADVRSVKETEALKKAYDTLEDYCFNIGRRLVLPGARSKNKKGNHHE